MHSFLKNAFANEEYDKPDRTASGLTGGKKEAIEIKICGKKVKAIPGQRMQDIVRSARAPIKFDCEKGDCGSCESLVNGRKMRICKFKVPSKPCTVEKLR